MFGSTILDVAVGMAFFYLLMSVVCSSLNEFLESLLKNRAKGLEDGIVRLLGDPALAQKLYNHPLIKPLSVDKTGPSYIPAASLSMALLNMAGSSRSFGEIRQTVTQLPDSQFKSSLLAMMDDAGGDLDQARKNVEQWFDAAMDRVSGWYKRRTQWFLLAFGLVFALALDLDSLKIADQLYRDQPKRAAIVAAAEGYAAASKQTNDVSVQGIKENFDKIESLGFPVGWTSADIPVDLHSALRKIFGLLATALAVSLGAPFWFDVLNRIMVVRSTVKPREKSPESPSKDQPVRKPEENKEGGDGEQGPPSKS
ncbi:MAG: hypothetical protein ACJ75H_01590 [Thermoanaerobaculia bacterium]